VLARWHRQTGDDTWLLRATDSTARVLRTAVANDTTPKEWADTLVTDAWLPRFLKTINIANDDFIRTTDGSHEKAVTIFLQKLYDGGFIYSQADHEGYYCVGCREYKQLDDLAETADGDFAGRLVCKIHGRPVDHQGELLLP
jgi:methionyl-tRNA synthetase